MRKLFCTLFFVALIISCNSTKTGKKPASRGHTIAQEVQQIINATDPNVNMGIKIVSLGSGDVVFEQNAERHFIPASTSKLFTLAAALHYLGPSFRFKTPIFADSPIDKSGTVKNIYIQGSGDPSLMDHDLIALAHELKQLGVHKITGTVYVDDSIFDDLRWSKGTMWDDRRFGYAAPVSGLNLNYNRVMIKTVPSYNVGAPARSLIKPVTTFVDVIARAATKKEASELSLTIERHKQKEEQWPSASNDGLHAGDKIFVNGHIAKSSLPRYHMLAVNDPALLAATFFKDQLTMAGVKVDGPIKRGITPKTAILLTVNVSRSLAEALIDFTKISNNIANDSLVKAIAAERGERPATAATGLKFIQDFLTKEVGIKSNSLITADGSGLSRYNLVTPDQMVKLLTYVSNHFYMAPEFMAALPLGGKDGTLFSRLTADHTKGNVRAKTGAMEGVASLVGYLTGIDGGRYAFAIMINNFVENSHKYKKMQDEILSTLLKKGQAQR